MSYSIPQISWTSQDITIEPIVQQSFVSAKLNQVIYNVFVQWQNRSYHKQVQQDFKRCRKPFPVLSSFMTYHRVCDQINTTGATSRAGTAYPSGTPTFQWGSCCSIFRFACICCRSLFVLLFFCILVIVLSVLLRYTDSDYLFVWSLCCLLFFDIRILITSLFGHCVVCSSSIYGF